MSNLPRPILLVNDDEYVSEALRKLFELEGFAVETATDGWDALTKIYDGLIPGMIILDLMMPVMDGYEFREQQRKNPAIADVPVVVMSAVFDVNSAAVQLLRAKAYVEVPVDYRNLVRIVREHYATGEETAT